ncbi:4-hydroxy-3-methylbut-2-enyl diphosphate reductase [Candidatus Pelagibacter bacterium]|nr:4-hydroxy-3-methylbut-2-enyl diphosphate reductase [Candidatus Pelagibacter bacterium]MDC0447488.1 4-hydroxy-3-methylbut-2-enyl diphosphate reductase [Pelagibacteraceae bacterium]
MKKNLKIYLASPRGFCAGVKRAIEIVEKSLNKYGKPVYVRHEIVHNKQVVNDLREKGAIFIEELSDIKDNTRPVIFSAHGVPKSVPKEAEEKKLSFVDATCPLVSKVHRESEQLYKKGYDIILIGHNNHPEVIGTMGQLPNGSIKLIETAADVDLLKVENFSKPLAYITQTTLSVDDTAEIIDKLKRKFPNIKQPIKEDICYATTNRQKAVKEIAPKCDMFFVIGSRNSSNSVRLVEVAKKAGCKKSLLMHSEQKIPMDELMNSETVGISSGASAPDHLIQKLLECLKKDREISLEEVTVAEEKVIFKLPRELH